MQQQISLFADPTSVQKINEKTRIKETRAARSGTFTDNMKLPIHRWFRYSAGFSAEWAENVIEAHRKGTDFTVLDPFAGSGTTLLAAEHTGVRAFGFESHPFVARIANAKLLWCRTDGDEFSRRVSNIVHRAQAGALHQPLMDDSLLTRCYSDESLAKLVALRRTFLAMSRNDPVDELVWLCLTAILRVCSHAGTAQWQYVLPNKTKARVVDPYEALLAKAGQMRQDMLYAQEHHVSQATLLRQDAREGSSLAAGSIDLVITSPPYPNNYDYADATRLEMTFWGEITGWGELNEKVRKYLIRSCSQHSAADRVNLDEVLDSEWLMPIRAEIYKVCHELAEVRLTKGGKKAYHTMVAAYFMDLSRIFRQLRLLCRSGARMCLVIGDSAPYGVYVPADEWLGRLAVAAGFKSYSFDKLRDRNVKWKNRKHDVPLQEGYLWIEG